MTAGAVELEALQAHEKATIQALRALRTQLAALRLEEETERRGQVEALQAQRPNVQKAPSSGAAFSVELPGSKNEMVVVPATLRRSQHSALLSAGANGARIEAKNISRELEAGKLVVFRWASAALPTARHTTHPTALPTRYPSLFPQLIPRLSLVQL